MTFFHEVRFVKAPFWEFSLCSIVVWTNLPNTFNDYSNPFENSLNFFVYSPNLDQVFIFFLNFLPFSSNNY